MTTVESESSAPAALARCALVGALFDAWYDLDLTLTGLTAAEMIEPWGGGSAFAWTYGHVANSVDAWINVRFQRLAPHPIIGDQQMRFGGTGRATDWPTIQQGVADVREATRRYLRQLADADLDLVIPYDGSIVALHEHGLSLRHAITVNLIHHHYHLGEISTKRGQRGHPLPHLTGPHQRLYDIL